jgi:hypothetical protein
LPLGRPERSLRAAGNKSTGSLGVSR